MLHVISCTEIDRTALYQDDKLLAFDRCDYLDSETIVNLSQRGLLTEPIRYYWMEMEAIEKWDRDVPESFAALLPDLIDRTREALGHE